MISDMDDWGEQDDGGSDGGGSDGEREEKEG